MLFIMLKSNLGTTSNGMIFADELVRYGPDQADPITTEQALAYCRHWAASHCENFTVASILLPRRFRQDFLNIYAYCRWSDDLADSIDDPQESLQYLDWWQAELKLCLGGRPHHPILLALQQTIQRHSLELEPFYDLLQAFRQDQRVNRYANDEELQDYCQRSANPVGRILLQLARATTPASSRLSDAVCTGLQLANFCQDMSRDAQQGRIYLPRSRWLAHGVSESMLLERSVTPELRRALAEWVRIARQSLLDGWPLVELVPCWMRTDVDLFVRGGLAILEKIEAQQCDVWTARPEVNGWTQARLLAASLMSGRSTPKRKPAQHSTLARLPLPANGSAIARLDHRERESAELRASRRWCAQICRQSRSSFLASFALLDAARRQATCALYAFARIADDLGDSNQSTTHRTSQLQRFRDQLWQHCDRPIAPSHNGSHPTRSCRRVAENGNMPPLELDHRSCDFTGLWPALSNCIDRYQVPIELLDEIIVGVAMDVQHRQPNDWSELQHYCHHVASAVGLACTHIWRKPEPSLEIPTQAASDCGVAFQLTNILRDIGEDARDGRIYIPQSLFDEYGVDRRAWLASQPSGDWYGMLEEVAERTRRLYLNGWPTIHILSPRSRRMFSLIWHSYRELLPTLMSNKELLWSAQKLQLPKIRRLRMLTTHALAPLRLLIR